jgi:hypothetical protein
MTMTTLPAPLVIGPSWLLENDAPDRPAVSGRGLELQRR